MNNKILFFDIFTTQNELYGKHNCPIQFTCEEFSEEEIYDKDSFLVNPKNTVTFNIIPDEDITSSGYVASGINNSMISDSEHNWTDLKTAMMKIYDILNNTSKNGYYIAGFNHINYDLNILNQTFSRILMDQTVITFERNRVLDIMKIAELVIPVSKCGSYSMDSVFVTLFDDIQKLHSVRNVKSTASDIRMTKLMLIKLIGLINNGKKISLGELSEKITKLEADSDYVNFGKYRGLRITEIIKIDAQYLTWIANNKSMKEQNPILVEKVKKVLNDTMV